MPIASKSVEGCEHIIINDKKIRASIDIVKALQNKRAKYKTKKEADLIFSELCFIHLTFLRCKQLFLGNIVVNIEF